MLRPHSIVAKRLTRAALRLGWRLTTLAAVGCAMASTGGNWPHP